ncbi:radial spoke head 1 homolog isoform X2 [Venturia canescens]|nr:radial spoke head 1 homolog isoform X2 [Venturia canescens]
MYVGRYCKGLRHGKGLYVLKNGARYEGDWRFGLKHGQGTFWYPDGTRYEGDWKRDTKYGFGAYHYANRDVYEGGWKKNLRHGLGTYLYEATGTKFMGTWTNDRMQGPGQLVHSRHRFHGSWELNLPYGRGCFVFENGTMQHGHYVHQEDPNYQRGDVQRGKEASLNDEALGDGNEKGGEEVPPSADAPKPLKQGIRSIWRARYVTLYSPELLPEPPMLVKEKASTESLPDECRSSEVWSEKEEFSRVPDVEQSEEFEDNSYGKNSPYESVTPDFGE